MPSSEAVTKGIRVEVTSRYVAERSAPEDGEWFFAYTVRISNEGSQTVQLLSRHWIITDAEGRRQEVKGPGVVGEQPTLRPGESFEYTSACPLGTSIGAMQGTYQMVTPAGERFDAQIAAFTLSEPYAMN
ncbi:MAG TPA: Co2+/Mg2+ efflux protein ApaG [Myxococcota bacterium]|nr:Co2+/Mg2+ efflux protein ApaG [Myxococcota bacterium]